MTAACCWVIVMVHLIYAPPADPEPANSPEWVLSALPGYSTLAECATHLEKARADAVLKWRHEALVLCVQSAETVEI